MVNTNYQLLLCLTIRKYKKILSLLQKSKELWKRSKMDFKQKCTKRNNFKVNSNFNLCMHPLVEVDDEMSILVQISTIITEWRHA